MVFSERPVILSLKPLWADRIYQQAKRMELRRRGMSLAYRQALVYESAPVSSITGRLRMGRAVEGDPDWLWRRWGARRLAGMGDEEYAAFSAGCDSLCAIDIAAAERIDPVPLRRLRQLGILRQPPMRWCRMNDDQMAALWTPEDGGINASP